MKKKQVILYLIILELCIFSLYYKDPNILTTIQYGFPWDGTMMSKMITIFLSCLEVIIILVPINDIWQLENMIRPRVTIVEYYWLAFKRIAPNLIILIIINLLISIIIKENFIMGNLRILLTTFVGLIMTLNFRTQKYIFFEMLILIMLIRIIFGLLNYVL